MVATDFLTILGIGIAIWAFIPRKERRFVLLFFGTEHIALLIFCILLLHYLFSFDWLLQNWLPQLSVFSSKDGIPAYTYAYIVSLLIIAFPIAKVTKGFFSKEKTKELILLYNSLLQDDEIDLLVGYIKKYHLQDIKNYLINKSYSSELDEKIEVSFKKNRFAQLVYIYIIKN